MLKKFIRRAEVEQWKKKTQKLRARNVWTGLAIGAVVVGIYGYTFYSVSQEKIMDEIDKEASVALATRGKTTAN
uniref:Cytochrome c oxidase assembly factor 3 n=1 Tax=Scleropages formosus TaxID=113540 RepID=A0A8C9WD75_SCLFO